MPTRDQFDEARALFDEAVAIYEAAKREFEVLQADLKRSMDEGRVPARKVVELEDAARARLFFARVRLSRHQS